MTIEHEIIVNIIANLIYDTAKEGYRLLNNDKDCAEPPNSTVHEYNQVSPLQNSEILFKVFDIRTDIERVHSICGNSSCLHFILEDKPSTNYILPVIIMESAITRAWFVFSKGNLSFQGHGGGKLVQEELFRYIKQKSISTAFWIGDTASTDELSSGKLHWNEIRNKLIPLHSKLI